MRVIITGATGLIGAEVVRDAMADEAISEIILLVRSQPGLQHPKISVVLHKDFTAYIEVKEYFIKADAVIWCLGISQTQVTKKQYEVITYDYVKACADFCLHCNSSIRFVFVSGDGADRTEKSSTIFKRLKGKAENFLLQCGLQKIIIARPGAVRPRHKNPKAPFLYKLAYPLFPLIALFSPAKVIWSDVLGKALLHLAKEGYENDTLENLELKIIGEK